MERLQQLEQTHLKFKFILSLEDKRDELNFVREAVAIANKPPAGYILVGVSDEDSKTLTTETISNHSNFDDV